MEYLIPGDFLAPSPYTCVFSSPLAMNFVHNVKICVKFYDDNYLEIAQESAICMFRDVHTPRPICVFTTQRKKQANEGVFLGVCCFTSVFTPFRRRKKGQAGLQIQSAIQGLSVAAAARDNKRRKKNFMDLGIRLGFNFERDFGEGRLRYQATNSAKGCVNSLP